VAGLTGKICLVTGASGFRGGWVVEKLIEAGARPRCLVRRSSRRTYLDHPDLELALGDVTEPALLRSAVEGVDVVFHVAGLIKATRPEDYFRVNYLGTINLLEALRRRGTPPERVVVVSSQTAGGPSTPGQPADETMPPCPVSPYGKSKLLQENAARAYADDFPIVIIRPPSVYGPRDRETLLLFQLATRGIRPVFPFPGTISAVHVADLSEGLLLAAIAPRAVGRTYYLSGDETPAPTELMRQIALATGGLTLPVPLPRGIIRAAGRLAERLAEVTGQSLIFDRWKAEEVAHGYWACSNRRAKDELGFAPRYTLERGLRETAAWYREHGWIP
jgi:nucleoside-diphosphate-sugar epimerase